MSWYEKTALGKVGTVSRLGVTTPYVYTQVNGLQCNCYAMARNEIAPVARRETFEGTFGGKRYFCGCSNPVPGSGITLAQAGAMVQTPAFKQAASQAIAAELGVASRGPLIRTEDYEVKHGKDLLVLGIASVAIGVGVGVFLFSKGKKAKNA